MKAYLNKNQRGPSPIRSNSSKSLNKVVKTYVESQKGVRADQISALFDVRLQQWVRVDYWPNDLDHCKTHVLTLVERVQAGTLLLFDRGYFSFAFFDQLSIRGIWWISRYAHQASYQVSHICYCC